MPAHKSTRPVDLTGHPVVVHEVYLDLDAVDLKPALGDADTLILRVSGLTGPGGRPTHRSIRLPADLFRDTEPTSWEV